MKKITLFIILSCQAMQGMYHDGKKLKHSEVTLTNKASIPLEISWVEILPGREGRRKEITRTIQAGQTTVVKLGETGGYLRNEQARVVYNPIPGNEAFKQKFTIDLPSSKAFAFTAVKLADILNNIWVPGVLKADEKGNFSSFQYMNMQHPSQWEEAMKQAGGIREIK